MTTPVAPGPRLVLIGPPGAGKSTVGRLLAQEWDVTFRDTDSDVEVAEGRSIPDIFVDDGEDYFRRAERTAVATALREHDGVLALGGGAVLNSDTQAELAGHTVVFLSVGLADAAGRVGLTTSRPLLLGSPRRQWQLLMDARRGIYERLATAVVPTDGLNPEQVRDAVLAEMTK
ncbi:shikimate kinase [Ruania halotolerans]|uniref:shikimate kinase n=1 Tax=Ruania halotolerans TaxID=2897773 RepID=UPI001E3560AE|nr:shikimate kinase [Ruania halotolerans]UFU04740.1 shikimate kinase [Ruania halotolerans]